MQRLDLILILHLVVFLFNTFLGIIVIKKSPKSKTNRLFAIYALSLAMWNISLFSTITNLGGHVIQLWCSRLAFSFYLLMINSFFYFAVSYPNYNKKIFSYIYWPLTFIFFILTLTPLLVVGDIKIINGFITGTLGPLIFPFSIYYSIVIIISLVVLLYKTWKSKRIEKIKLSYMSIGFSVFALPMLITNMILPVFFGIFDYNNLGPLFSFPMLAIIGYAIVKHRFLDIEIIIKRGLVFTLLFSIITGFFIFNLFYLAKFIGQIPSLAIVSIFISIFFEPFKKLLENITNKLFFRRQYKFEDSISEISDLLLNEYNIRDLLKEITKKLQNFLQTDFCSFVLIDNYSEKIKKENIIGNKEKIKNKEIEILKTYVRDCSHEALCLNQDTKIIFKDQIEFSLKNDTNLKSDDIELGKKINEELDKNNVDVVSPIYSNYNKELIALLLIGSKKSNDPFYDKDINLLEFVSSEIIYPIEHSKALRKLQETDKIKTEFIDVLSLNLRSPFTASLWDLEAILDGDDGSLPKKAYSNIINVHKKIKTLSNGLNAMFSVLEIDEHRTHIKKNDNNFFADIFEPVLSKTENDLREKDMKIKIVSNIREIIVTCDLEKIQKILHTLISNSIEYSPAKSVITVDIRISKNKNHLNICVEDQGIGISHKDKNLLFEKFYRGKEVKKIKPDGLGVDLYISKKFAEMHKGNLSYREKETNEAGSKFILELPLNNRLLL